MVEGMPLKWRKLPSPGQAQSAHWTGKIVSDVSVIYSIPVSNTFSCIRETASLGSNITIAIAQD